MPPPIQVELEQRENLRGAILPRPFTASSVIRAILAGLPSIADSDPGKSAPKPLPQRERRQVDMIHPIGAGTRSPLTAQSFLALLAKRG